MSSANVLRHRGCGMRHAAPLCPLRTASRSYIIKATCSLEPYYSRGNGEPNTKMGPIQVADIPGKGRGVVATRDLGRGDLVMVSEPLAVVWGEPWSTEQPDSEQLFTFMTELKKYSAREVQLMGALYNGSATSLQPVADGVLGQGGGSSSEGEGAGALPFASSGYPEASLWGLIGFNCFGDGFQDLPLAIARGEDPRPQLGVWPEFSLINHSCLPNAVNYLMGDRMVVRAVKPVPAGQEVLINYLGRSNLRPVQQRYAELEECYGFFCQCRRCRAEFEAPDEVSELLNDMLTKVATEVGPALQQALDKTDAVAVGAVRDELLSMVQRLEQLLQQQGQQQGQGQQGQSEQGQQPSSSSSSSSSAWFRASAYDALNLVNVCHEQLAAMQEAAQQRAQQDGDGHAPAACETAEELAAREHNLASMVGVVSDVAAGSDLHVFVATKRLGLLQRMHGDSSQQAQDAARECLDALMFRYGRTSGSCQTMLLGAAAEALQKVLV